MSISLYRALNTNHLSEHKNKLLHDGFHFYRPAVYYTKKKLRILFLN